MKPNAPSIVFEPQASRYWQYLLLGFALVLIVFYLTSTIPLALQIIFATLTALALGFSIRSFRKQMSFRFALQPEGAWLITPLGGSDAVGCTLYKSAIVGPLVVMRFHTQAGVKFARYDLLLLPDSLPADTLRRLKVWLRQGRTEGSADHIG